MTDVCRVVLVKQRTETGADSGEREVKRQQSNSGLVAVFKYRKLLTTLRNIYLPLQRDQIHFSIWKLFLFLNIFLLTGWCTWMEIGLDNLITLVFCVLLCSLLKGNIDTLWKSNRKSEITQTWIRHAVQFSVCVRHETCCLIMAASVLYIRPMWSREPHGDVTAQ